MEVAVNEMTDENDVASIHKMEVGLVVMHLLLIQWQHHWRQMFAKSI